MAFRTSLLWAMAAASVAIGGALAQTLDGDTLELPGDLVAAATAFQTYTASAAAIGPFSGADSVVDGLRAGVAYEPVQLEQGMIAYAAIAALQDDAFLAGVERAAPPGAAREALRERLIDNPYDATQFDGAASAVRRIEAALGARAAPLVSAGVQAKQAAYTVQHQAWSRETVADAQGRLAEVKRLSAVRAQPGSAEQIAMIDGLTGARAPAAGDGAPAGFTLVEAKALALAAESILDGAHGEDRARLTPLLSEPRSAMCLRMAKLNLYQCMAVAGPQYEDIFCLGQHAMMDTGACVADAVHGPAAATMTAFASTRPSGGVYVPLASHRSLRIDPEP